MKVPVAFVPARLYVRPLCRGVNVGIFTMTLLELSEPDLSTMYLLPLRSVQIAIVVTSGVVVGYAPSAVWADSELMPAMTVVTPAEKEYMHEPDV